MLCRSYAGEEIPFVTRLILAGARVLPYRVCLRRLAIGTHPDLRVVSKRGLRS
mgnify:CR=1 FL=1